MLKHVMLSALLLLGSHQLLVAGGHSPELESMLAAARQAGEITPAQLKEAIDKDTKLVILDAREADQRAEGEILSPASGENVAITRGNLEFEAPKKLKDKHLLIVTYCRSGPRGMLAADTLRKLGYTHVKSLQGGLKAWMEQGNPVETGAGTMILKKD